MSCSSRRQKKKGKKNFGKLDLYALKDKYRFNENELIEFKQRFNFLSNAQDMLDKETFRENMGLLGLDSESFLADRIFAVLDVDKDGHIQLEEYLKYFDILIYGSQDEKYDLSFRMIDLSGKGWFTFEEFKDMIMSMLYTWNNLTGSHYNVRQNQKLDYFLTTVFTKFDVNNTGKVTSQNFKDVVTQEPQLLEIFDYFNQGIIDSVQPNTELDQQDLNVIDDLESLYTRLNQLKEYIGSGKLENSEAKKDSQRESKVKELPKPGLVSPQGELKTPVVSSLDSRIKKTIFFEPFKEELERHFGMGIIRQQSDNIGETTYRNNDLSKSWTGEFSRRKSEQHPSHFKNRELKTEPVNDEDRNGRVFSKFKSVDVIYQEGNSAQSNSYHPEGNPSFFKREKESFHHRSQAQTPIPDKKRGDDDLFSIDNSPDANDNKEKEEIKLRNNSFLKDHQTEEKRGDKSLNEEPFTTRSIMQKRDTDNISLATPKSRKLDIHFQSTPIRPKILDTRYDNPDYGSIVNGEGDPRRNLNLTESIIITRPVTDKNALEIPDTHYPTGLQKSNTSPVKIQQLTEQIGNLASETLKIIDEIKNKKRNTMNTINEIQEDQKKIIAQNIHRLSTQDKQQSNFVSFGHQNWNLVLNMMLGIQIAVKSVIEKADNVTNKDFDVKFIFELVPKRTSETKDSYKICTFFDYAPNVFYEIRRLFGIKNEDYLRSIGPEAMLSNLIKGNLSSLSELTSSGKSGSFFYYSADGKYTLKTISREEFHFLRKVIKNYYTHIIDHPHTLMIKFFGLHKIRFLKKKGKKEKVYFVIMANVFHTFKEIHVRYDLKGSTVGRYTNDKNPSVAKKDLNFLMNKEKIMLPPEMTNNFLDIIEKDTKFFEENHIIDYSLLMGIHYMTSEEINNKEPPYTQRKSLYDSKNFNNKDGVPSSDGTKLYFFGIIDILTQYNTRKKAEYVFKRITSGKGISAVPPLQYAQRFRKFIASLVDRPKIEDPKEQQN